jgi:dTDP-4-dehydrorhamnose 3,5-epimerase
MNTDIEGVIEFVSPVHDDIRGFFTEVFRISELDKHHQKFSVKQVNHARSSKNTLRGIHVADWNKLIYVPHGSVQAVVVDCRKNSDTFGKYKSVILGDDNKNAFFVPAGCGNSYLVISEGADYMYFIDKEWEPNQEKEVKWDDPDLNIMWMERENLSISERDLNAKSFKEVFQD